MRYDGGEQPPMLNIRPDTAHRWLERVARRQSLAPGHFGKPTLRRAATWQRSLAALEPGSFVI